MPVNLHRAPGAAISPSKQAARNANRAQTAGPIRSGSVLVGSAATDSIRVGQWTLTADGGDLMATGDDGRSVNLTARTGDDDPSRAE